MIWSASVMTASKTDTSNHHTWIHISFIAWIVISPKDNNGQEEIREENGFNPGKDANESAFMSKTV